MKKEDLQKIIDLRKKLHEIPEEAFKETRTKSCLMDFIKNNSSLEVVDCGSWFYAKWTCETAGDTQTIGFRADFDGVVIADGSVKHLCGHDGHSAVLAGFAVLISQIKPLRNVFLIFQPAEEIGEGGKICSAGLTGLGISSIYGFHNIPGYELGTVLALKSTFACASTGMEISVTGRPSHAAYPEAGKNPATVISSIIFFMNELIAKPHKGMVLGTVIGIDVGSCSYGVSAGEGILRLTLRAALQEEFESLVSAIKNKAGELCSQEGMECRIRLIEQFPATENDADCVEKIKSVAASKNIEVVEPEEPFRWSEDFGYYLMKTKGAFFGVGCGKNHAQLHTADYEFADEITGTVLDVYEGLLQK